MAAGAQRGLAPRTCALEGDSHDATYVHPQLFEFFRHHVNFMDAWNAVQACYEGSPEIQATTQVLGRNVWLHAQRDAALQHLRGLTREADLSFAWAI